MLNEFDLLDLHRILVVIRANPDAVIHFEVISKILDLMRIPKSNCDANQLRKVLRTIPEIHNFEFYSFWIDDREDSCNVTSELKFGKAYFFLESSLNELRDVIKIGIAEQIVDFADCLHNLPTVILDYNYSIPKFFWKTYVEKYRKKWGFNVINSICLEKFMDSVECNFLHTKTIDSFPMMTLEVNSGMSYGLVSDFGFGSWAFANCIGGRTSETFSGKMFLNNREIHPSRLLEFTCFVYEDCYKQLYVKGEPTIRNCIESALELSGLPYTVEQIKEMFSLTDERFDRHMDFISGEKWLASAAIGFAAGKKIFVYPWLNELYVGRFEIAVELGIVETIKKSGGIVIVPSSQKMLLRRLCDKVVIMDKKHYKKRAKQL